MAAKYQKKLHMFNSQVLQVREGFSGVVNSDFELVTGSRLVWALSIKTIDPGASIVVNVKNGFTRDFPFETILILSGNSTGFFKKVLTDTHNLFNVEVSVVGGVADYALGVSISDNAMTTRIDNAEISVDLNHQIQSNGAYDSTRIGDGVDELSVNTDGSINVNIVDSAEGLRKQLDPIYNESSNVPKNILTEINSYTAPLLKRTFLQRVICGGGNIASYQLERFGNIQDKVRSYFGSSLTKEMNFIGYSEDGLELVPGEIIRLKVLHTRPVNGDFESRFQLLQIG